MFAWCMPAYLTVMLDNYCSYQCAVQKLFEPNPCILDCCHAIPFAIFQPEISHTVDNNIRNIHGLDMCIPYSGDVREIEKFFDVRE